MKYTFDGQETCIQEMQNNGKMNNLELYLEPSGEDGGALSQTQI